MNFRFKAVLTETQEVCVGQVEADDQINARYKLGLLGYGRIIDLTPCDHSLPYGTIDYEESFQQAEEKTAKKLEDIMSDAAEKAVDTNGCLALGLALFTSFVSLVFVAATWWIFTQHIKWAIAFIVLTGIQTVFINMLLNQNKTKSK